MKQGEYIRKGDSRKTTLDRMGDLETPNLCHFLRKSLTLGLLQTRVIRYSYLSSMLSIFLAQIIETTCWLIPGIRFT